MHWLAVLRLRSVLPCMHWVAVRSVHPCMHRVAVLRLQVRATTRTPDLAIASAAALPHRTKRAARALPPPALAPPPRPHLERRPLTKLRRPS